MPPKPLILAFDTSAAHCAVALVSGEQVLAQRCEPMVKGQAERLFPLLDELLFDGNIKWLDLTLIGVGVGPGNFTGVRISVSAARGLALSMGIPAIGINGFEAQALNQPRPILTSIDARGGRSYVQLFDKIGKQPPLIVSHDSLPEDLTPDGCFVTGHAATELAYATGGRATNETTPIAVAIARLAAQCNPEGQPRPAPLYMRPADAAPPRGNPPRILP